MAVTDSLVEVILPDRSGMATDQAINTFALHTDLGGTSWFDDLKSFYNDVPTGGVRQLARWLSGTRNPAADACRMRIYDITGHLNGSPHGPPIADITWTLNGADSTSDLPNEVAVVGTFHGDYATIPEFGPGTRPRARHRGRIFLGPLSDDAAEVASTGDPVRPNLTLLGDLTGAMLDLASSDAGWSVWSRRNAALYPVTAGWADNAFDTIRGRGIAPTSKVSWALP